MKSQVLKIHHNIFFSFRHEKNIVILHAHSPPFFFLRPLPPNLLFPSPIADVDGLSREMADNQCHSDMVFLVANVLFETNTV